MDGWILLAVQAAAVVLLAAAVLRRSRAWNRRWIPVLIALGVSGALAVRWCLDVLGLASEPAPVWLWVWTGACAAAVGMTLAGWRGAGWATRNADVFAASMCLLSVGLVVNSWIGYFPTVQTAFGQLTSRPLPHQVDPAAIAGMQHRPTAPSHGAVVPVSTGAHASGFEHREEYVYLPPAWFSRTPAVRLPALMMIGGQFNTPADWVRAGRAVHTLDGFAASHGGYAPVTVFADPNGTFANDTECVNGARGNAADHLVEDVVPYVARRFDVPAAHWGVVGFSSGGTCAVDLTVMHPGVFGAFVDIAGDLGPNAGTTDQTIARLYGGDAEAWARFDPSTVIRGHGHYIGVSGRFVVPASTDPSRDPYLQAATTLCTLGTAHGIGCSIDTRDGRHTWPFAADAFAANLPWLADQLRNGFTATSTDR
ncbi:putative esterase [Mycolicibacterium chubuense NBB4]|uniref:Putative esterase n=2 Tax=Mycolicibacterium chubuense TaxID=1800 RepID=I4BGL3_MYCCN|nr:putative esterase [Mycolicibacterium chubuense NBB4]